LAAHAHQDLPFEKLVEELAPERSLARSPLFQVMFALQNAPVESLEIPGLQLRPVSGGAATVKFDLELDLREQDGGLSGMAGYATDLFDGATIDRLIGHFERTLAAALATPELPVAALLFLTGAERHQLLVEWNDTETRSLPGCLHHDVAAQAVRTPAAVAVEMGIERWTYRRLIGSARRLARHLRALGIGPDVVVGLCAERSPAMVVGMLAVLEAGGAWLPLDPGYPADRLAFMLEDSAAQVLLIQESLRERITATDLPVVLLDGHWDCGEEMGEALGVVVSPDHLAYVIYTSGSTGQPKGVMVPHRGVCNRLRWAKQVYGLDEQDAFLHKAASSVDVSVWECFAPLVAGARLVLAEPGRQGESAYLIRTIREHRVTLVDFVPSMLAVFLDEAEVETCVSLRQVFVGGEALSPELRDRMAARLPIPLDNMYGPTEITIDTTRWVCAPGPSPHRVPIGRPIGNSRLYVVDRELRPLPLGVSGELVVGGEGVTRGYLGRPGLSAERFVPDPFGGRPGGRLYRTGDLARCRDDGAIEFLGRLDHQVKIRGIRIEPGEIEAALRLHPAVHGAVADVRSASAFQLLTAWVVPREGSAIPAAADLRAFLHERLPDSMVPAAFVALAALPLTPGGKVDRKALPAPGRPGSGDLFVAPRTPVEELLAAIWSDVLGVERVGVADSFFDLGGHSLLATQVMSRLRRTFGVEMPLRDLFATPRLADLAVRVEAALAAGTPQAAPPLVRIAPALRQGPQPLSFAQQRLWFIDQLEPGSALYNMPVALRVEGPLRIAVLRLVLSEIVRRHEALRTVFAVSEGGEGLPVQVVQPAAPFALPVVDLSGLPEKEREALAAILAGEEGRRPFDLTRDLMLHCLLLRLAPPGEPADHAVALTMHHIASDGWSTGILVREVAALYAALAEDTAGRPSPLPELPVQYADFAVWQNSWLHGETLERELAYWRRELAGLPPLLELPTDRPRPAVQSYRGATRLVRLPAGLTGQMEALARREGATLFMVLLAGFQVLLSRYSRQQDLAVGSPIAGRNRAEVEGLIGFFVNTLVLRGDLTGNRAGEPSSRELLRRVRRTALAAYTHQDVPFEKLVEELAPVRSLGHTPLFQVMFVLQNAPAEGLEIPNLYLRPMATKGTTAKFDLTLGLQEWSGQLVGAIEYVTELFDAATVERLAGHFERLLVTAVATPDVSALALPLLSLAECGQILREWNDTRVEGLAEGCLHDDVAAQAARTPSAVAVESGVERWTYRRLVSSARLLARHLRDLGVGPDAIVGLCAERSPAMVVGMLAVLETGGAYLPLDPAYPAERLAFMLDDSDAGVLLIQEHLLERVPTTGRRMVLLDARWDSDEEREALGVKVTPDHLAYVIYTSGSTGRPKGVMVPHRGVRNRLRWAQEVYRLDERDAVLQKASFSFDFSVWECFAPLLAGARLVLAEPGRQGDGPYLARVVREQRVTFVHFVPSLLAVFLDQEDGERFVSLRQVFVGGEALTPELRDRALARLSVPLDNQYGPTEISIDTTRWVCAPGQESYRSPIGRPIGNSRLYVVDPELRSTPIGVAGELLVGGVGVAHGYLRRPDLTAERFVPDPFHGDSGGRLYRTGDLVRWLPDGTLEFLGRLDHQVKVRGFRIELGEIETVLATLPGVREAVVAAREDTPGERRLVAYVAGEVAEVTADALRQALRERLPDYMVPATFVILPALPLTLSGKVDRRALPAPERQDPGEGHLAPRTPVEEVLAGIWAELLGFERVGAADHFFDLGGHSLLATRVMSRLRSAFGVEMPLRDLFEAPVLADLAARVEATLRAGMGRLTPPLVPLAPELRQGPQPLSFAQQRLWFIDQLEPGS
ncbi:MAG TPA: amino acid adenylation domain-containing protein, partial [Thermoanaerobaculia bacterium]